MAEFTTLGRDVAAAADSALDAPVASAVKRLWAWAGFDGGTYPNDTWTVRATSDANGFALSAAVETNVVFADFTSAGDAPKAA